MRKLTQRELGWLEGLIDGEGCIALYKNSNNNFAIYVQISNTCLKLLKKVKNIIGDGSIRTFKRTQKHYKIGYVYRFTYKTLKLLLPQLKLIEKEKQRLIIIKALRWSKERQKWGKWYPETNVKYLTKAHDQLKELKKV